MRFFKITIGALLFCVSIYFFFIHDKNFNDPISLNLVGEDNLGCGFSNKDDRQYGDKIYNQFAENYKDSVGKKLYLKYCHKQLNFEAYGIVNEKEIMDLCEKVLAIKNDLKYKHKIYFYFYEKENWTILGNGASVNEKVLIKSYLIW